MPKLLHIVPKYRHHKASGQAVVTLNSVDHYLGPWQSKASKAEYDRLAGEWLANGRRLPATAGTTIWVRVYLETVGNWQGDVGCDIWTTSCSRPCDSSSADT